MKRDGRIFIILLFFTLIFCITSGCAPDINEVMVYPMNSYSEIEAESLGLHQFTSKKIVYKA
jgi:hypothetical protein